MRKTVTKLIVATAFLGCSFPAWAGNITINLQWSGADFGNSATASGYMIVDAATLPNPGSYYDTAALPAWLLGLQITVFGASAGNGAYGIGDFKGMYWDTNSGTLDLSQPFIGQVTSVDPWGTTFFGDAGELNFFSVFDGPTDAGYFAIAADGGDAESMGLTLADPVSVPEPATYSLIGISLLGLAAVLRKRA